MNWKNIVHGALNLIGVVTGTLVTFDWSGNFGVSDHTSLVIAGAVLLVNNVVHAGLGLVGGSTK